MKTNALTLIARVYSERTKNCDLYITGVRKKLTQEILNKIVNIFAPVVFLYNMTSRHGEMCDEILNDIHPIFLFGLNFDSFLMPRSRAAETLMQKPLQHEETRAWGNLHFTSTPSVSAQAVLTVAQSVARTNRGKRSFERDGTTPHCCFRTSLELFYFLFI